MIYLIMKKVNLYSNKKKKKRKKKVLKELASVLELPECKVRSNIGGIAVSGEVILHSNSLYVLISQFSLKPNVLVRSCKSMTDYVGGSNNYFSVIDLFNDDTLSKIKNISKI